MNEPVKTRAAWQKPALSVLGSVEELTGLKYQGGYDGLEVVLDGGTVITVGNSPHS